MSQLTSKAAPTSALPFCGLKRAVLTFVFYFFPCVYLDAVASNYAVVRWNMLPTEQKSALPDIVHDSFPVYENHMLKEWPMALLFFVILVMFMVPYDIMGIPLSLTKLSNPLTTDLKARSSTARYRRGECLVRCTETRCVLELMRACTVWLTTTSDPNGLHCMDIETHQIDNIFTTWTFARCGDNIFSGHASNLLSLAICIQCYVLALPSVSGTVGSPRYLILTASFWALVAALSFYIVVSRLHYTVDVVLSWFLVPTVWLAWGAVSGPSVSASKLQ